ncbi:aminotransferase-like domain-containing protein [Desulfoplanes formicivorans]|uniref:aminotransferase-like domain-containing protein n=1 Tax=Desulfoplanes formicivorans TaxID=1592317 RepID=UPI00159F10D3|nr:PLP-dependent aminotransferase family protein [Desulfoplanes formicivorans]
MQERFSQRIQSVPRSFIREILKVTADPSIISFAGGLPNPELFPVQEMSRAARDVLDEVGPAALQYSTTEGFPPLREAIAARYVAKGVQVDPDHIIVTTGSQQCLDILGKILVNPGDTVVMERPGYLGAIQSFGLFEPVFQTVSLQNGGPDLDELERIFETAHPKIFYAVPNFQNPSGMTYDHAARQALADLLKRYPDVLFVEDDPYGELRFAGSPQPLLFSLTRGRSVLLGSFSKIASPGMRLGWMVVTDDALRDMAVRAKQASDLHTSTFTQQVMARYLADNDMTRHIARICQRYGEQCEVMCEALDVSMPDGLRYIRPEGGMFVWIELPEGYRAMELFDLAIAAKVAFVPGTPFYVDGSGEHTLRLNFSNSDPKRIREGIDRLAGCMQTFLEASSPSR